MKSLGFDKINSPLLWSNRNTTAHNYGKLALDARTLWRKSERTILSIFFDWHHVQTGRDVSVTQNMKGKARLQSAQASPDRLTAPKQQPRRVEPGALRAAYPVKSQASANTPDKPPSIMAGTSSKNTATGAAFLSVVPPRREMQIFRRSTQG